MTCATFHPEREHDAHGLCRLQLTKKEVGALNRRLIASLAQEFSLQEVGHFVGLTRERVRQIAGPRPRKSSARVQVRAWERPSPRDKRHVAELRALGMPTAEALELIGYEATGARLAACSGPVKLRGGWGTDCTWRGWKERWMREIRKLVAGDAIRRGATLREAAEVSGLPFGALAAYTSTGVLPKSGRRQGWYSPSHANMKRTRRQAGSKPQPPSAFMVMAVALWNKGFSAAEVGHRLCRPRSVVYKTLNRARARGLVVRSGRGRK